MIQKIISDFVAGEFPKKADNKPTLEYQFRALPEHQYFVVVSADRTYIGEPLFKRHNEVDCAYIHVPSGSQYVGFEGYPTKADTIIQVKIRFQVFEGA